jgi:3'(2'), 5'-bisphosphate nucleotidase
MEYNKRMFFKFTPCALYLHVERNNFDYRPAFYIFHIPKFLMIIWWWIRGFVPIYGKEYDIHMIEEITTGRTKKGSKKGNIQIMAYEKERQTAIEAVLSACELCREVQAELLSLNSISKKDRTPVTVADFGAQALISYYLKNAFPDDLLVGEEDSRLLRQAENQGVKEAVVEIAHRFKPHIHPSEVLDAIDRGSGEGGPEGRFWTVDPIDGTKGFLRNEQFAVALALVEEGEVVLGVLGCPNLPLKGLGKNGIRGALFVAVKGEGAFIRGLEGTSEQRIRVDDVSDPSKALFCESVESAHASHEDTARIASDVGVKKSPLRMDSMCKYGIVARGDASFYLRIPSRQSYLEKIWDHAAGSIMVLEAGGKVTDIDGRPLNFTLGRTLDAKGILASNGSLHKRVLGSLKKYPQPIE